MEVERYLILDGLVMSHLVDDEGGGLKYLADTIEYDIEKVAIITFFHQYLSRLVYVYEFNVGSKVLETCIFF